MMNEQEDLEYLKSKIEELTKLYGDIDDVSIDDTYDIDDSIFEEYGLDIKQLEEDMTNYSTLLPLGYQKLQPDVKTPSYNYGGDSGFDLYSTEEITIPPFGRALVPTGLAFDIQDGYEIQVRSKSGLAINQGLMVLNSPGTVDCFSDDMKILTIQGEKLINEIKIGELVYSLNEKTLEIEKDVITQIFDTEKQEIIIITTENGVLEITPNTEVYTTDGIILAKNLNINHEIINFF